MGLPVLFQTFKRTEGDHRKRGPFFLIDHVGKPAGIAYVHVINRHNLFHAFSFFKFSETNLPHCRNSVHRYPANRQAASGTDACASLCFT